MLRICCASWTVIPVMLEAAAECWAELPLAFAAAWLAVRGKTRHTHTHTHTHTHKYLISLNLNECERKGYLTQSYSFGWVILYYFCKLVSDWCDLVIFTRLINSEQFVISLRDVIDYTGTRFITYTGLNIYHLHMAYYTESLLQWRLFKFNFKLVFILFTCFWWLIHLT